MRPPIEPAVRLLATITLFLSLALPDSARAGDDEPPDPERLRPGLVATDRPAGPGATRAIAGLPRVVRSPIDRWDGPTSDPARPAGVGAASWRGWLLVREPGPHRFRVQTDGSATLRLGEDEVDPGGRDPIELRPGLVAFALDVEGRPGVSRVAVDWEGPGFAREHLPPHLLFHEEGQSPPADRVEQGRRLFDRLGCANCHAEAGLPPHPGIGPPLDGARMLRPGWLRDWIRDPSSVRPGTPMPGFGLDEGQASDLARFLDTASAEPAGPDREAEMAMNVADPGRGRLLFRSAGCLGCHPDPASKQGRDRAQLDTPGLTAGPDLAGIARARTHSAIADFLGGARKGDPGRHRPTLGLSLDAAHHLAAFLSSIDAPPPGPSADEPPTGDADRGRALARSIGCAACHAIPGLDPAPAARPLGRGDADDDGCLADRPEPAVPRFDLDDERRDALRAFVGSIAEAPSAPSSWTLAEDAIRRRNCLGCHSRYGEGGEMLGARLSALLAEDRELNALKGTLSPPDLSSVGAKLRPEALDRAIRGALPTARPWLAVRMPRYDFEEGEAEAIASYLRGHDAIDGMGPVPEASSAPPSAVEGGLQLLGRDGFGCVSCHVLDGKIPPGGEPETMGPDLALAHLRMERPYFERWLADPQRILPGTPMPQFLLPAPGNPGTLDEQLGAIWQALGAPDLPDRLATASREVLDRQGGRALVVRDMVVVAPSGGGPPRYYPRAIAIGLRGDRSLLFDADRLSWARWWDGAFLSRTKDGRLWEWHPEGRLLWESPLDAPPVAFMDPDGTIVPPRADRDRFGRFAELAFDGDGVVLDYRLDGPDGAPVAVTECIAPTNDGWTRLVRIVGTPDGYAPVVLVRSGEASSPDGSLVSIECGPPPARPSTVPFGTPPTPTLILDAGDGPPADRSFAVRVRVRP